MSRVDEVISKVLDLDGKATKAPWKSFHDNEFDSPSIQAPAYCPSDTPDLLIVNDSDDWKAVLKHEDARLIVYYRNNAPKLAEGLRIAMSCLLVTDYDYRHDHAINKINALFEEPK